jgi:hypothetical protein
MTAASRTAGWVHQDTLDLDRRDVRAAPDDQILLAGDEPEIVILARRMRSPVWNQPSHVAATTRPGPAQ